MKFNSISDLALRIGLMVMEKGGSITWKSYSFSVGIAIFKLVSLSTLFQSLDHTVHFFLSCLMVSKRTQ